MKIEILSPGKSLFEGEVTSVTVPGKSGSMGFLNNHAPLITVLKPGDVKVKTENGEEKTFTVNGGVVEVQNNKVVILAD